MWGALLGTTIEQVCNYYCLSTAFYTRVVGLKHSHLSQQQITKLTPGTPVIVILKPDNQVNPNAMLVLNPNGIKIGYLRKPLAQVIAERLAAGVQLTAKSPMFCRRNFIPTEG